MSERHRSIIDVHLLLRRQGNVLMLRRANTSFGEGMLCFPSGHLERGESVVEGVLREAREEVAIIAEPSSVRLLHVLHRGDAEGNDRVGFFFEADRWDGEPANCEPAKCSELVWVDPDNLPDDVIPYQAAGLAGCLGPEFFALHGWDPAQA